MSKVSEQTKEQALPCPFCGCDDVEYTDQVLDMIQVDCTECGAFGPGAYTHEEATRLWNIPARLPVAVGLLVRNNQ